MAADESHDDKTQSFVALTPGTKVSQYEIVEKIGSGGMGEVYLARDTELDRKVALKFLPARLCESEDARTRFKREAQAVARLDHPNIVTIYGVSEYQGRPYLAMQLVNGKSLGELAKGDGIDVKKVVNLALQICEGLGAAHQKQVVHRDIKPSNIVIDADGRPKILDFGLATIQGQKVVTRAGTALGTVLYMSPEQACGEKVDHRSDLFSFGVVLYELIAKRTPFERKNEAATLKAIAQASPEPLARYKSQIPDELQRVISKLMEKDPILRYQTAAGVRSDLLKLVSEVGQPSSSVETAVCDEKSILVLPLQNLSSDPDNDYFSDGLTDEIITDLSGIDEIRVLSRATSLGLKGKTINVRSIGPELGVRYILTGSVRKAGDNIRITAQLIEAARDQQIWADKFKGSLDDIFEMQEDVSASIVSALKVQLSDKEEERLKQRPIGDAGAYELYLRAQSLLTSNSSFEDYEKAERYLRMALDKMGDNATLYADLSYVYFQQVNFGYYGLEYVPKIREYLNKSMAINSETPVAHMVKGLLASSFEGKPKEALESLRRANELSPQNTSILRWLIVTYCNVGKVDRARRLIDRIAQCDPLSPRIRDLRIYSMPYAGEWRELVSIHKSAFEEDPESQIKRLNYVSALVRSGDVATARDLFSAISDRTLHESTSLPWRLGKMTIFGALGNTDRALACINEELIERAKLDPEFAFRLGVAYVACGMHDEGLAMLETAQKQGMIHHKLLSTYTPLLKPLYGNPRFEDLVRRTKAAAEAFEF